MKKGITIRADSEISRQHTIDLTGINPKLQPSCLNKPTQCLTGSFGSTHEDRSALVVMINRNGWSNRDAGCGQDAHINSHC